MGSSLYHLDVVGLDVGVGFLFWEVLHYGQCGLFLIVILEVDVVCLALD